MIIPKHIQKLAFERAKAPGLSDRKSVHISNIDRLTIAQPRDLWHGRIPNLSQARVYDRSTAGAFAQLTNQLLNVFRYIYIKNKNQRSKHMNKHDTKASSSLDKFDFSEDIGDHPLIIWLSTHKQTLLYVFLACVALIVIAFRFLSNAAENAETAYLKADVDFGKFQDESLAVTEPAAREEAFLNLQTIMNQYPDLHAKYDGLIAESLIIDGKVTEAEKFAQLALSRTQHEDSPFYVDFAKTSLQISKGAYESSLKQAIALKEQMLSHISNARQIGSQPDFGQTLFALNLVRIAILQQELGNKEGELKAWEDLQQFANVDNAKTFPFDPSQLKSVLTLFNEGDATIWKYMESRIQKLTI